MKSRPILSRLFFRIGWAFNEAGAALAEQVDYSPATATRSMADECNSMRLEQEAELAGVCTIGNVESIQAPFARGRLRTMHAVRPVDPPEDA